MELAVPHRRFHRSYVAALEEFVAAGEELYATPPSWPAEGQFLGVDFSAESLRDPADFDALVRFIRAQAKADEPRPNAYVAFTELWMVEGNEYLGRISLRHELNDLLREWGGHIGYAVRPSARRRGLATAALEHMLDLCAAKGIDPVLVTCDVDNFASKRTIEKAGGVYEDTREGKLRFWIRVSER